MLYWLFRSRSNEQLLALWLVLTDFFSLVLLQSVYVVCCSLTSLSDIVTSRLLVWIMTWFSLLENTLHIYSYGLRNKWFLCSEYVQTHTCDICYCVCFSVQMNMKSFYFSCLLYDDNKLSNLISYSPQQCRNFAFRQHLPTISFMFWHLREKSDIKTELPLQNRTEHLTGSITLMQRNESKIIWVTQKTERKSKLQTLWNRPDSSWSEPIPGLYRAQIKTTHRVLWDRRAEPLKVQQSCNTCLSSCLSLLLSVSAVCCPSLQMKLFTMPVTCFSGPAHWCLQVLTMSSDFSAFHVS